MLHRLLPPRRLVLFSALRAALDVGEEEGNGTAGEIGHGPLPFVRPVVVLADCRMSDGQTTSEWLTIASSASPRYTGQVDSVVLRFTADDAVAMAAD